jgi:hypothetical protein
MNEWPRSFTTQFAGVRRPDRLALDRIRHVPGAHALLVGLREQRDNSHAPLHGISDRLMEVRMERSVVAQRLDKVLEEVRRVDARTSLTVEVEDHPALVIERTRLADMDEEIAELQGRYERLGEQYDGLSRLVGNLERWLVETVPSAAVIRAAPAVRPPRKSEDLATAIERCRRRVRELDADLARINAAPPPSSEAKKLAREQLAALAARGRPQVRSLVNHGGEIQWPYVVNAGPQAQESAADAVGLLAWLFRDQVASALDSEIDAIADDAAALTPEQRADQRARALADRLAIEREEEAFVRMVVAGGAGVMRRPDCDPRAVLGLSDDLPGFAPEI